MPFTNSAYFNTEEFVKAVKIAVRGLDAVIDENLENHALPEQATMAEMYRNIGLGIMGLHDCFIKLGITYGSQRSIQFADSIMGLMFRSTVIASSELAREKGTFPAYDNKLLDSDIIMAHFTIHELDSLGINANGLRNCSLLSIAPTGSLGTMLNISTGCEPLFALYYNRKTESLNGGEDKYYKVYTGIAEEYMKSHTGELPEYFNCSKDVQWHDRVDMQSVLQDHVDTAISSTINLPHEITVDEIEQLYLYSWQKGLKGVTIFRDGCKRSGILSTDDAKEKEEDKKAEEMISNELKRGEVISCSNDLIGKKRKLITGCGSLHALAYFDPETAELQECYLAKGSTGGCNNFMIGLSRLISLLARSGVDVYTIKDQLDSCGSCPSYAVRSATKHDTSRGSCCPVAIGNALIEMYKEAKAEITGEKVPSKKVVKPTPKKPEPPKVKNAEICPVCGAPLVHTGGCISCTECAWSKCD